MDERVRHLAAAALSVAGPHRDDNQDSTYTSPGAIVVADGVGGRAGGAVASSTVVEDFARWQQTFGATPGRERVHEALVAANEALAERVRRQPPLAGMATTFTGAVVDGGDLMIVHVGDSRALKLGAGGIERMTRDDSLVQDLVDAGEFDAERAHLSPLRSVVTRALAGRASDAVEVGLSRVPATVGDRWILASDGLTDYVDEPELARCAAAGTSPEEAAAALLDAAVRADSHDNISVVVADVVAEALQRYEASVLGGAARSPDDGPSSPGTSR